MEQLADFWICGNQLLRYEGVSATVTVPQQVEILCGHAFGKTGNTVVREVTLPEGLMSIETGAFKGCYALQSVNLPQSLYLLYPEAFASCSHLRQISIPAGVTAIAEASFSYCTRLKTIRLHPDIYSIEDRAFSQCRSLAEFQFPQRLTTIGELAFAACHKLESVILPKGVTTVGNHAFFQCYRMRMLSIPDTVTSIGKGAFEGCSEITVARFPRELAAALGPRAVYEIFGDAAFRLVRHIMTGKAKYTAGFRDWLLAWIRQREYMQVLAKELIEQNDLPVLSQLLGLKRRIPLGMLEMLLELAAEEKAMEILAWLMDYKRSKYSQAYLDRCAQRAQMEELGLNLSPIELWRRIFRFCIVRGKIHITGYKGEDPEVTVPGWIGQYPVVSVGFADNYDWEENLDMVQSLRIEEGVREIKKGAFCGMRQLQSVTLPDSLEVIGAKAFRNCRELTQVVLPPQLVAIGEKAFFGCEKLLSLDLPRQLMQQRGPEGLWKLVGNMVPMLMDSYLHGNSEVSPTMAAQFQSWMGLPSFRAFWIRKYIARNNEVPLRLFLERCGKIPMNEINRYLFDVRHRTDAPVRIALEDYRRVHYTEKQIEDAEWMIRAKEQGSVERTVEDWRWIFRFYLRNGEAHITDIRCTESCITVPRTIGKYPVTTFFLRPDPKDKGVLRYRLKTIRQIIIQSPITVIEEKTFARCVNLEQITLPESLTAIKAAAFGNCDRLTSIEIPASVTSIGEKAFHTNALRLIRGKAGSVAEAYAKANGIEFEIVKKGESHGKT